MKRPTRVPASMMVRMKSASNMIAKWYQNPRIASPPPLAGGGTGLGYSAADGLWEQIDESTGKAEGWFRITQKDGVYEGVLVKGFGG